MNHDTTTDPAEAYRHAAKRLHAAEGEIEFDADAAVSPSEDGAYVQAWIWVDREALSQR